MKNIAGIQEMKTFFPLLVLYLLFWKFVSLQET